MSGIAPFDGSMSRVLYLLDASNRWSLKRLALLLLDNCIAFGDGTNDIEMLTWAGVGISMGNAETEAVTAGTTLTFCTAGDFFRKLSLTFGWAAADHATVTNDEDGVALVLERMLAEAKGVNQFRKQLLETNGNPAADAGGAAMLMAAESAVADVFEMEESTLPEQEGRFKLEPWKAALLGPFVDCPPAAALS